MIEPVRLQIGAGRRDFGYGGLRKDVLGDVLDRAVGDLVNEADIAVFAGDDRETTSRRVTSGSTMASRPRRP